jgi:hypothetical protein
MVLNLQLRVKPHLPQRDLLKKLTMILQAAHHLVLQAVQMTIL